MSLLYVSLPSLLFALGWLKPVFAVPLAMILSAGVYLSIRESGRVPDSDPGSAESSSRQSCDSTAIKYVLIALMVAFVVAFSGIGGYSFQMSDYPKHNAFFRDLIENPWPLAYQQTGPDNRPGNLNTYFGYYLPAAAVGKVTEWAVAQHFSYVWAALGVFLAVLWFLRFVGRPSPLYALLFLFFGGIDILGQFVTNGWPLDGSIGRLDYWMPTFALGNGREILHGVFFMFASNFTGLMDGPHHVLPAWICIFMLLHDAVQRRSAHRLLFLWALVPVNSAFVAVGMAPYVLVSLYETRLKKAVSFPNVIAAPLILLVSGLYFLSNNGEFVRGWLWEFQDIWKSWPHLFLYYIVEFGLYVLCIPILRQPANARWRIWYYASIACLLLLPWYRMGSACDFTAKAACASLLVFQVCLAVALKTASAQQDRASVRTLVFLLFLGSFAAIGEMAQAFEHGFDLRPRNGHNLMRIDELEPKDGAAQLFSDGSSFFWRVLARPVIQQPSAPLSVNATWDFATLDPSQWHWAFVPKGVKQTAAGAVVRTSRSGPLVRLSNVEFNANDVAAISIALSTVRASDPQRKPAPIKTAVFFTGDLARIERNRGWPYVIREACWFGLSPQGYMAWVSEEQTWRGTMRDLCISVNLPEDGKDEYDVCVSSIQFLRR